MNLHFEKHKICFPVSIPIGMKQKIVQKHQILASDRNFLNYRQKI